MKRSHIFRGRISWFIQSKAVLMSSKTIVESSCLSMPVKMASVAQISVISVEWKFLFPLCSAGSWLFVIKYAVMIQHNTLSPLITLVTKRSMCYYRLWVVSLFGSRCYFCLLPSFRENATCKRDLNYMSDLWRDYRQPITYSGTHHFEKVTIERVWSIAELTRKWLNSMKTLLIQKGV